MCIGKQSLCVCVKTRLGKGERNIVKIDYLKEKFDDVDV